MIRNIADERSKAHSNKYNQQIIKPIMDGNAPHGAVVYGRARKPPPIVVPAIRAADERTDEEDCFEINISSPTASSTNLSYFL